MISIAPLIHKRLSSILCFSTLILVIFNGVVYSADTSTVNAAKKENGMVPISATNSAQRNRHVPPLRIPPHPRHFSTLPINRHRCAEPFFFLIRVMQEC